MKTKQVLYAGTVAYTNHVPIFSRNFFMWKIVITFFMFSSQSPGEIYCYMNTSYMTCYQELRHLPQILTVKAGFMWLSSPPWTIEMFGILVTMHKSKAAIYSQGFRLQGLQFCIFSPTRQPPSNSASTFTTLHWMVIIKDFQICWWSEYGLFWFKQLYLFLCTAMPQQDAVALRAVFNGSGFWNKVLVVHKAPWNLLHKLLL